VANFYMVIGQPQCDLFAVANLLVKMYRNLSPMLVYYTMTSF